MLKSATILSLIFLTTLTHATNTATFTIEKDELVANDPLVWQYNNNANIPEPSVNNVGIIELRCSDKKGAYWQNHLILLLHQYDRAVDFFPDSNPNQDWTLRVKKVWDTGQIVVNITNPPPENLWFKPIQWNQNSNNYHFIFIHKANRYFSTHGVGRMSRICRNTKGKLDNAYIEISIWTDEDPITNENPTTNEESSQTTTNNGLVEGTTISPVKGAPFLQRTIATTWAALKKEKK